MTTPNPFGGRRDNFRGRGRGRGNNLIPYAESSVPTIGTLVQYSGLQQQSNAPKRNEDIPSSSSGKPSYKDAANNEAVNEPAQKEYFENPIMEIILHIEEEDVQMYINNGWAIKTRYLESRGYPGLSGKGRMNMEIILTKSESMTITHYHDQSGSFITYSKCHINKIMTPKEWSLNPNGDKSIDMPDGKKILVNYWDYVEAFTKTFYYQNPRYKHSWFFTINPNVIKSPVPNWVLNWWSKFGPSVEILPQNIKDQYDLWCDTSPLVSKYSPDKLIFGQCPFLFFAKFQVPWIWKWSISVEQDKLNIPCLQRNFFYKWWSNMPIEDVDKTEAQIRAQIIEDKEKGSKEHFSAWSLRVYFKKKYPNASEEDIMVKILDHMKHQFFSTYPQNKTPQTDEDMKSQSSQGSQQTSNPYNCLAGESQDEDELDSSSPTPEDVWDMMITTIAQSAAKGKGKQL